MKKLILIPILLLTSCQALMEEHQRQMAVLCTYEGAYSAGVEDFQNNESSRATQKLSGCQPQAMQQALRGYNDGYAQVGANAQPTTIGGIIGQVIDQTRDQSFSCEIKVFTDTFSAKGRTQNEALFNAKKKCRLSRHDGDFFCKKNADYRCSQLY